MSFIVMLKSVNDVIVYKRSDKSTIAKVQKYSKVAELLLLLYECHHLDYDYSLCLYKNFFYTFLSMYSFIILNTKNSYTFIRMVNLELSILIIYMLSTYIHTDISRSLVPNSKLG